ncbi:ribosomal protein S24e-domain-containing protein [Butyriboletus roseoflavus]|nr:ribosomal protein S24e-domain-containing protein [Butyriboletus roseoflavus]
MFYCKSRLGSVGCPSGGPDVLRPSDNSSRLITRHLSLCVRANSSPIRLLSRRQFIIDVLHPSRPNVSKANLQEKLATLYKTDKNRVVLFGLRTQFGGGKSTGFALIYDDEVAQKKFEPKHRLIRSGIVTKVERPSRKLRHERKNRAKKVRGTKKTKAAEPAKKGK